MRTTTNTICQVIAVFALAFTLSPWARAVSPPPDGGYAGGNTAEGDDALLSLNSGLYNTAIGFISLESDTEGNFNTAVGAGTLLLNMADDNTALGRNAGANLTTNESNNIDIGFNVAGVTGESNTIRIGNNNITDTFIRGVSGTTIASGATVLVASDGHLGTVTSSERFKENIKPMDKASEALFSLKPVTFRYKKEIDPNGTPQFGLVAEDVEKINPDLVLRDETGRVNSLRYDQVNAMLLNEFLKEHRRNEEQQARIARLQKQLEAVALGLQKVSAQVGLSKGGIPNGSE